MAKTGRTVVHLVCVGEVVDHRCDLAVGGCVEEKVVGVIGADAQGVVAVDRMPV